MNSCNVTKRISNYSKKDLPQTFLKISTKLPFVKFVLLFNFTLVSRERGVYFCNMHFREIRLRRLFGPSNTLPSWIHDCHSTLARLSFFRIMLEGNLEVYSQSNRPRSRDGDCQFWPPYLWHKSPILYLVSFKGWLGKRNLASCQRQNKDFRRVTVWSGKLPESGHGANSSMVGQAETI